MERSNLPGTWAEASGLGRGCPGVREKAFQCGAQSTPVQISGILLAQEVLSPNKFWTYHSSTHSAQDPVPGTLNSFNKWLSSTS